MSAANDSRFWKWSVVLLLVANTSFLGYSFLKKDYPHEPGHHPPHERAGDLIIRELEFTPEQIKSFNTLRNNHRDSMDLLMRDGRELREKLTALLTQESPADSLYAAIVNSIGNNQALIEAATYRHFRQVKSLCDSSQSEKFDAIIDEVMKRFGHPHGPPPPDKTR